MEYKLTIAVRTLGCKVNQCDAEALICTLKKHGHNAFSTNDFSQTADVFVINTCTVTHVSDKKSRQMISRAKKQNPGAFIALCGCMAKKTEAPAVDFIFDARKPDDFLKETEKLTPINASNMIKNEKNRTRAFIKIQDGCDRFCSYCIVPYVRGGLKNRGRMEILNDAQTAVNNGALEIVLTGIQVASYGHDTGEHSFSDLIKEVAALNGLKRLRLSSIDPCAVNDGFLEAVAASPALCGHFHLSLQSGCNAVLKKMNRRYTTETYAKALKFLLETKPETAFTTDIIVGFPGETEADFEESLAFAREMKFAKIHVFEFSPREGTPAAQFPGPIPSEIKSARGKKMRALASELQKDFLKNQQGKEPYVLFEQKKQSFFIGNSENYCSVKIKSEENLTNTIRKVKITAYTNEYLTGELI